MAIDTQNKRRSVQAYTLGLMRPVPDGTVSAADRAVVTWFYSGLGYAPPVEADSHEVIWIRGRRDSRCWIRGGR